ncbi:DNA-3-methyladenine glycosylase [Leucobacter chinensis]|uniref:DNA-3-methyladenine glycosylase n=1 Tax=Leucobacter chinensis TaxID=2851010 RepID=UPI001C22F683|nr:DNA-3-methyladenine glycosylase [Leucobacter chinensis]
MNRSFFFPHALEVAPRVLGTRLTIDSPSGQVTLRITEVEAYHGVGVPGPYDAGSHSKDRKTDRNASMFGEPGHAYVYLNYGMHYALNLVCSPSGIASGVLVRSAEIVEGTDLAIARRLEKRGSRSLSTPIAHAALAKGPGNLAAALGITRETHDGLDLFAAPFHLEPPSPSPTASIMSGPRVGVAGHAGGSDFAWRFWFSGDPTVSAFRPGRGAPAWRPPRPATT